jgi:hypothetical protein
MRPTVRMHRTGAPLPDSLLIIEYGAPPNTAYGGKFLQIRLHRQEYMLCSPAALHPYHSQILARFVEDEQIPYRWVDPETLELDAPELTVLGGGRFEVNLQLRMLSLWGHSQAYGRFEEHGLAQRIASTAHPWSELQVRIG